MPLRRSVALGLCLIAATIAAYWPVFDAGFIWDDDYHVTENPTLRNLDGLRRIWLEPGALAQYYPLVFTTFWIEYHLWGLEPLGFHLVNVLLHAFAAVLCWRLLRTLAVPGGWWTAAIFALHPVAVESVAWITERKNVLSGLFYFAAFLAYARLERWGRSTPATNERSDRHQLFLYLLSFTLFLCALLSKTVTLSMPAAVLLVIWWQRGRIRPWDVGRLLPFFAAGVTFGAVTAWMEKFHVGAAGIDWQLSFFERTIVAGRALWFYASKLLFPAELAFNYRRWEIDGSDLAGYLYPAAFAALIAALFVLRRQIGRGPLIAVLFFAGTLFPALGFVDVYPMRYSFVADHFQYHAMVGLIALVVAVAVTWFGRFGHRAVVPAVALLAALSVLTWRQTTIYQSPRTLWQDTIEKNPQSWLGYSSLAATLGAAGELEESVAAAKRAIEIYPRDGHAYNNLGASLIELGRPGDAIPHLKEALELDPVDAEAHSNLGNSFYLVGSIDAAIRHLGIAVDLDPGLFQSHEVLANALLSRDRPHEAMEHFQKAIALAPRQGSAHLGLGILLARVGRLADASERLATAARLAPTSAEAQFFYGKILVDTGRAADSVACFQTALRLDPGLAEAARSLAWLRATHPSEALRNGEEALALARQASSLTGNSAPGMLDTLAAAYAELGRFAEAAETAGRAIIALDRGDPRHGQIEERRRLYERGERYRDLRAGPGPSQRSLPPPKPVRQ